MKRYIRAYWYDEEESIDDFIYGRPNHTSDEPEEFVSDTSYEDIEYNNIDEYDLYDYSEYEDFYKQIKRRQIFVPLRVSKDIPDYNAYRKKLFGTLCLSMQYGESIEDIYNELYEDYSGIIRGDATSESDMLLEIVDAVLYAQRIVNRRR